uniref:phosphate ABC transporter permease n=1 Tax=Trichocoleus desertorum TaxID=1481672 RepID=UPI0025B343B7|nr:phosphate ABC transporter permease [Trichocoleus desertorum]
MLVPLTREKFEQLVPLVATFPQYKYHWGKLSDFLKRLLISVLGIVVVAIAHSLIGEAGGVILFFLGVASGLYWLWAPILWATLRNLEARKPRHSGFWQGRVLDAYVSEELIGTEETVNKKGELVLVENRERRLNLEVGDESGFRIQVQVPLRREHKAIRPDQPVEMVVMSHLPDLSRIAKVSDIYIPSQNIWVSDYPQVQRDNFLEVSRRLRSQPKPRRPSRRRAAMDM